MRAKNGYRNDKAKYRTGRYLRRYMPRRTCRWRKHPKRAIDDQLEHTRPIGHYDKDYGESDDSYYDDLENEIAALVATKTPWDELFADIAANQIPLPPEVAREIAERPWDFV